jgi:hypothetical protein
VADFAGETNRRAGALWAELHDAPAPTRIPAGRGALRWVVSRAIAGLTRTRQPVRLITANRETALGLLSAGNADLAVIGFDPPPKTLRCQLVATYPQLLVIGARHRLADQTQVRLADLAGLDLLVPPADRPHRGTIDQALAAAGVDWRVAAEVDGWDLLVHFAHLGLGATIVNGCVRLPPGLCGVPVQDLPEVRYWAAWRAQREAVLANALRELGAT